MPSIATMRADLAAEHTDLDHVVADLSAEAWETPTPSPGWAVRDQIGHLGYFDRTATQAIVDPEAFTAAVAEMLQGDPEEQMEGTLDEPRSLGAPELLTWWREGRANLLAAAEGLDDDSRVPWYGPSMGGASFLTARLMETWAHGQDIADALGVDRTPTDRLRHTCHIGFITRGFAYMINGREQPESQVRLELTAPSGEVWTWGPDDAQESVIGTALDFALTATQRRHVADTSLAVTGSAAADWMTVVQTFAGGPGAGREEGQFA